MLKIFLLFLSLFCTNATGNPDFNILWEVNTNQTELFKTTDNPNLVSLITPDEALELEIPDDGVTYKSSNYESNCDKLEMTLENHEGKTCQSQNCSDFDNVKTFMLSTADTPFCRVVLKKIEFTKGAESYRNYNIDPKIKKEGVVSGSHCVMKSRSYFSKLKIFIDRGRIKSLKFNYSCRDLEMKKVDCGARIDYGAFTPHNCPNTPCELQITLSTQGFYITSDEDKILEICHLNLGVTNKTYVMVVVFTSIGVASYVMLDLFIKGIKRCRKKKQGRKGTEMNFQKIEKKDTEPDINKQGRKGTEKNFQGIEKKDTEPNIKKQGRKETEKNV